ncbi:hypothetical protein SH580_06940 [Coraliomargarita algicola]|uniref:DUF4468 domain-containing protein n=1 Tax=Coraliomargarita algicola TaxID=3092156 RepID=A0ABZ0RRM8_9BACT|nr:hypothetical protein [Coraliomargarita sp. J2-16]WPJ97445.1 hypothetical protein SH580_06940 [Coraliomargarita sp. J2-16]
MNLLKITYICFFAFVFSLLSASDRTLVLTHENSGWIGKFYYAVALKFIDVESQRLIDMVNGTDKEDVKMIVISRIELEGEDSLFRIFVVKKDVLKTTVYADSLEIKESEYASINNWFEAKLTTRLTKLIKNKENQILNSQSLLKRISVL